MSFEKLMKYVDLYSREVLNPTTNSFCKWPEKPIYLFEHYVFYTIIKTVQLLFVLFIGVYIYKLGKPFINSRRTSNKRLFAKYLVIFIATWVPLRFLWAQAFGYLGQFLGWFITKLPSEIRKNIMNFLDWSAPYLDWVELFLIWVAFYYIFYKEIRRQVRYVPGLRRLFHVAPPNQNNCADRADEMKKSFVFMPNHTRNGIIYQPLEYEENSSKDKIPTSVMHMSPRC